MYRADGSASLLKEYDLACSVFGQHLGGAPPYVKRSLRDRVCHAAQLQ